MLRGFLKLISEFLQWLYGFAATLDLSLIHAADKGVLWAWDELEIRPLTILWVSLLAAVGFSYESAAHDKDWVFFALNTLFFLIAVRGLMSAAGKGPEAYNRAAAPLRYGRLFFYLRWFSLNVTAATGIDAVLTLTQNQAPPWIRLASYVSLSLLYYLMVAYHPTDPPARRTRALSPVGVH